MPFEIKINNSQLKELADELFEYALSCNKHKGKCDECPDSRKGKTNSLGYQQWICKPGISALKSLHKYNILEPKQESRLDIYTRNYTGLETGFTLMDLAVDVLSEIVLED